MKYAETFAGVRRLQICVTRAQPRSSHAVGIGPCYLAATFEQRTSERVRTPTVAARLESESALAMAISADDGIHVRARRTL